MFKKHLTKEQAHQKARYYCAYQERCHKEVKEKLYDLGMHKNEVEEIISELVQDNYLNEERFAILFAGGKFRTKQWGKTKIKYELKQKQVSAYCITKALNEIDETDYISTFEKLVKDKLDTLSKEKNIFIKMRKLQDYLRQKGYESDLIRNVIQSVEKKQR
jgi:regulatory protein